MTCFPCLPSRCPFEGGAGASLRKSAELSLSAPLSEWQLLPQKTVKAFRSHLPTPTPQGLTAFGSVVSPRLCAMRLTTRSQPGIRHTHPSVAVPCGCWKLHTPPFPYTKAFERRCARQLLRPWSTAAELHVWRAHNHGQLTACQHREHSGNCSSNTLLVKSGQPGSSLHVPPTCLGGCH